MYKKTYTPQEFAKKCGVEKRTIYEWIKKGFLTATEVGDTGKTKLITEDDENLFHLNNRAKTIEKKQSSTPKESEKKSGE